MRQPIAAMRIILIIILYSHSCKAASLCFAGCHTSCSSPVLRSGSYCVLQPASFISSSFTSFHFVHYLIHSFQQASVHPLPILVLAALTPSASAGWHLYGSARTSPAPPECSAILASFGPLRMVKITTRASYGPAQPRSFVALLLCSPRARSRNARKTKNTLIVCDQFKFQEMCQLINNKIKGS